jgi:rfaE bifunctional protein kinase chain/domain
MNPLLTDALIEQILGRLPSLTVGVLGDLFLDRYLELDARLTEPSLETGLDAYQVVRVRSIPGAAGTVLNNLAALGVGRICTITVIGDDGEGYELRQALDELRVVDTNWVFYWESRRTPTYVKPVLHEACKPARELNRLDVKNRTPLPHAAEQLVLKSLAEVWPQVDALLVLDQVSEAECGVVTSRVRDRLAEWGERQPERLIIADSRERIGLFRATMLKPNATECVRAILGPGGDLAQTESCAAQLAERCGRPVFCTRGELGILLANPFRARASPQWVPAYPVTGPIDVVGAGDSTSAAIACAAASGATLEQAAAFGNLVASITVQQIGTTGTASPEQVRRRWCETSTT